MYYLCNFRFEYGANICSTWPIQSQSTANLHSITIVYSKLRASCLSVTNGTAGRALGSHSQREPVAVYPPHLGAAADAE